MASVTKENIENSKQNKEGKGQLSSIFFTLLVALVGGSIAVKLKVPAGAFIGSMLLVAVIKGSGFELGSFPSWTRFLIQIVLGTFIGLSVSPEVIHELKQLALPATIIVVVLVSTGIVTGLVINKMTNLDMVTSLFSAAPGGMSDMVLISSVLGADAAKVAALHLVRIISIVVILPMFIRWIVN